MDDVQRRDVFEKVLDTDPRRPGFQPGYTDEDLELAHDRGERVGFARAMRWVLAVFIAGLIIGALVDMIVRTLAGV